MSLFFDQVWFDARLAQRGLNKSGVAAVLGLTQSAVEEIWKDQREITPEQVMKLGELLGVPASTIASHAGVSTPVPKSNADRGMDVRPERNQQLESIDARLSKLEKTVAELKDLMRGLIQK